MTPHSHRRCRAVGLLLAWAVLAGVASGGVTVTVDHNDNRHANDAFRFARVPMPNTRPVRRAIISVIDGTPDEGGRRAIYLGKRLLPEQADDPKANFFFAEGTDGGRLRIDLGPTAVPVGEVDTYSWHPGPRGPQVYTLWASDGSATGFDPAPARGVDPASHGWHRLADVDTRAGPAGGQYGVQVADPTTGTLGTWRFLLLDVSRTESTDAFGNTFFSKVDVLPPAGQVGGVKNSTVAATSPSK